MTEAPQNHTKTIKILTPLGLHARPCAKLAQVALKFTAEIEIFVNQKGADAKSIIDLLSLAATKGTDIIVCCKGDDAEQALIAMEEAIATIQKQGNE